MDKKIAVCIVLIVVVIAAVAIYAVSLDDDSNDNKETRDPTALVEKEDKSSLGGWYSWNPYVLKVRSAYIAYSPSAVTALEELYEGVYGEVPETSISASQIPSQYQTNFTSKISGSYSSGGLTIVNAYNIETGTAGDFSQTITSKPGTIISCSATTNDTIYYCLCQKYGEVPYSGNTPKAEVALWNMIYAGTDSATTKYENNFDITVPDSVVRLGGDSSKLDTSRLITACYDACQKYGSCMVFMSDAIPAYFTADKLADIQQIVKNTNTTFVFFGSSSINETLACTELISSLADLQNEGKSVIENAQVKIYSIKKAVDEYNEAGGKQLKVYMEAASGKAASTKTIIGSLFAILGWQNIFVSDTTSYAVLGDLEVVKAQPDIIVFYDEKSDKRTVQEQMRITA